MGRMSAGPLSPIPLTPFIYGGLIGLPLRPLSSVPPHSQAALCSSLSWQDTDPLSPSHWLVLSAMPGHQFSLYIAQREGV